MKPDYLYTSCSSLSLCISENFPSNSDIVCLQMCKMFLNRRHPMEKLILFYPVHSLTYVCDLDPYSYLHIVYKV